MKITPYQDQTTITGSTSGLTLKLAEIPEGYVLKDATIYAYIKTTILGDYNTAKYINLGVERAGVVSYIKGTDVGTSNTVIANDSPITIPSGWRPIAYFEETAVTVTYTLHVMGNLVKSEEDSA